MVVWHRCTFEGRKPDVDKLGVITQWGPCENLHDINAFLGTVGVCRMFIENFSKIAEPLNQLKKKGVKFKFGKEQADAMQALKDALVAAPALLPIDYTLDTEVVLTVDSSYMAVGYYIWQEQKIKKRVSCFGSITFNEREANFSQSKRELYALLRALDDCKYWLFGCRKLVVERDALYLKGMLSNPGFVTIFPFLSLIFPFLLAPYSFPLTTDMAADYS